MKKIIIGSPDWAANEIGVCKRTLLRWRAKGTGPRFTKVGRTIRYNINAVRKLKGE